MCAPAQVSVSITTAERSQAITRGKAALTQLEEHPGIGRSQLGAARERLNDLYRLSTKTKLCEALAALEHIASDRPTDS